MPLIPMHPSLYDAYRFFQQGNQRINIITDDVKHSEDLIINVLADNLQKGKTTCVIVSPDQDPAWVAKALSSLDLAKYCLVWTHDYLPQQRPLQRIQLSSTVESVSSDADALRILKNQVEDIHASIERKLAMMSAPAMGGYSWKDLLLMRCKSASNEYRDVDMTINKEWSETDVNAFLYELGDAEIKFQQKYILLNSIKVLNPTIYHTEYDVDDLIEEITAQSEEIKEIENLFKLRYRKIKAEIRQQVDEEYILLSDILSKLSPLVARIEARKTTKSSHRRILSDVCTSAECDIIDALLSDLQHSVQNGKYIRPISSNINLKKTSVVEFTDIVHQLSIGLSDYHTCVRDTVHAQLKRLGPHNVNQEGLHALDQRLSTYVDTLNASELLYKQFQNNGLSFEKKLAEISEIKIELHKGLVFMEQYPEYHQWRSSLHPDQEKIILNELSYTSEVWKYTIRQSLIRSYLDENYNAEMNALPRDLDNLKGLSRRMHHLILDSIHAYIQDAKKEQLKNLRSVDAYLYEQLVNSGSNSLTSTVELFIKQNKFFNTFFPIVITNERDYIELSSNPNNHWDTTITLSLDNLSSVDDQKEIIAVLANTSDATLENAFRCPPNNIQNVKNLRATPRTHRYEDAARLSSVLIDAVSAASVYQMRNVSIISVLPIEIEEKLCTEFINQGIKCIHHKSSVWTDITEAMVNADSDIYLLHENGLLGATQSDRAIWDVEVLHALSEAGIQLISVDSAEMYLDQTKLFKSIRQTILASLSVGDPVHKDIKANATLVRD